MPVTRPAVDTERLRELCARYPAQAGIAHHEAGHVAVAFEYGVAPFMVSIDAIGKVSGYVNYANQPFSDRVLALSSQMTIHAAGPVAQAIYDGTVIDTCPTTTFVSDWNLLTDAATQLLGLRSSIAKRVKLIDQAFDKARQLVECHWDDIQAIACCLLIFHDTMASIPERTRSGKVRRKPPCTNVAT